MSGQNRVIGFQGGAKFSPATQSALVKKIAAVINRRPRKSEQGRIWESYNPLFNLDLQKAQQIYDNARRGNYAHLQWLYNEIENCDPTFLTCVTRRCSALSELDWKVVRSDERLNRNTDKVLVDEQIACVETALAKIDNIPEALEHLALSAFRGFSVLNTWFGVDGMPMHLECLDHWNICFDKLHQSWKFNPDASPWIDPMVGTNKNLVDLPSGDIVAVTRKRQIDWPALKIFLRNSIGERDWGRFLETYGLPPVIITMPEFTSKEDEDAYVQASESIFEGRSGVVPFGSEVNYASESRGTDPFSAFIEHQMKLYVLLSTGGTLTSLSESGSGTLAGNAQMEVWKQILRGDIRLISNAINKQLCENVIKSQKDFKGKPILAEFQLDTTPQLTADEILELAGKAVNAGFEMDAEELSKKVGFTLKKKVEGGGMGFNANLKRDPSVVTNDTTALNMSARQAETQIDMMCDSDDDKERENAESMLYQYKDLICRDLGRSTWESLRKRVYECAYNSIVAKNSDKTPATAITASAPDNNTLEKQTPPTAVSTPIPKPSQSPAQELAESLQDDFKAVADRINAILSLPDTERAEAATKLISEIDSLIPDDPAMAEVIAEQMDEAFKGQLKKETNK